ncbi:MAG: flagellar biosynthetic protein FliR [Pseudomonadota bacterium]
MPLAQWLIDLLGVWGPWMALAVARPAGFALVFSVFAWGHINSGILRMGFAMVLAMPLLSQGIDGHSLEELALPLPAALAKEVFLGVMLAFFASVPMAIAVGGGGIIDFYRGSFNGTMDPASGQITPVATLFAICALWIFANLGGFWIVAAMIYTSYEFWPVQASFPEFKGGAATFLHMIEMIALGALVLAGPMVFILFISDMVHLASTKFGKQINVTHLAFSSKNLLVAALLPVFMIVVVRALKDDFDLYRHAVKWMELAFR